MLDFEKEILDTFYKDKDTYTYKFKIINVFDDPLIDEETRSMYFDEFYIENKKTTNEGGLKKVKMKYE